MPHSHKIRLERAHWFAVTAYFWWQRIAVFAHFALPASALCRCAADQGSRRCARIGGWSKSGVTANYPSRYPGSDSHDSQEVDNWAAQN
jgi:hypothetical protein